VRSDGLASWVNEHLIQDPLAKTQIGSNAREWNDDDYNPVSSTLFGSYCWSSRNTLRSPLTKENFSANLLELLTATLRWQVEKKKSNGMMVISGVRLRTNGDSDRLTIEEQLQGGQLERLQGEGQRDLKALPSQTQGDQGDLINQIKELEKTNQSLLEKLRSLEEKNLILLEGSSKEETPALVSLTQTEQEIQISLEPPVQLSPDYSTYPHRTSNDIRAKKNRADRCKEQMLLCTTSEELEQFKSEGGFSKSEIEWVYGYLLLSEQQAKVDEAEIAQQMNLLEEINHDWNQLLTAIDVELARLGWSVSQAKEYVMSTYHKRSRKLLSDRQLIEFWQYLKNL
jgi:putative DNA primase/helicase